MKRLLVIVLLTLVLTMILLWLAWPVRAGTLYLPLIRGGHVVTVTGRARWEPDIGPVAHRRFALLEVVCENPPIVRHSSESPHARTDAEGRFAFRGVGDGAYVLAIETHPPFGWALLWQDTTLCLVAVEGESVDLGVVRVGVAHLWGLNK